MKILHTSDWHLGRQFHGQSLEEDHAVILAQVLINVREHDPDVLIIAGDIFDRASPPASAVKQFNEFLNSVAQKSQAAIVIIAGNHDSGDRIATMATLADKSRVLIRGPLSKDERPLILEDEFGKVAITALPYGYELAARECFEDISISSPADVLAAQLEAGRIHVPEGARWVVVAHAFVANSTPSESERHLVVGGIETVPADLFSGAHYVALGHLHRQQKAGAEHVRYCGALLALGFDESGVEKCMLLADLAADGVKSIKILPFKPLRAVRTIKGQFADILAKSEISPSNDFIKLVLTDEGALIDPMTRLREHYPNALVMTYERDEKPAGAAVGSTDADLDDPIKVIEEFFKEIREEVASESDMSLVAKTLNKLGEVEMRK
ncbi:exonuclease sbcCD subunit D [Alphaproteobacteria bacterium 46_93_T64]|nr:exonuclease sbcCD subunit D [Alphaproteobacteria bacterium 46_93_T64]